MTLENPYRAAGAFGGKAYIRRDADAKLVEQIEDNQYYPYFAAPRQSGKSSLLLRTMAALDPKKYRCALVDLSPFVVTSYDDFWRQFLHEVARSANFDPAPIGQEDPRDVFLLWLRSCRQRLIVFLDEIDVLLNVDVREQIFSKFRTFFNLRARLDTADLQRLQFVLAGAAHSSRFIKDPRWSPFNVAIEIELEDLSPAQVSQLAAYLGTAGGFAGPDLTARVHELSGGSVFLCQLIFEQLWNQAARGKARLGAADVDAVVQTIVAESPRNIHFYNIFRLVTADARLTMLFRRLTEGQELGQEEAKELRLTGICRGANPFRNDIYARVFGPGGPLDLKVGDKQIQLTRALDGAIARRDLLQNDPRADPRTIAAAEAEIKRLRKEFREGAQLQVGDVLGRGRYRLEERIGQGGFAAVWRATDSRDQSLVAIKVLHGQFAEDKSRRERFFRGAWKMSELQHPAIVRVLEPYGDENGQFYFVMEHLPGGTLHDRVQEMELAPDRALRILMQIGVALHFAHERGLVHRDVKPSNVLIDGERGKLTDFDLVRETDMTGGTRTGAMGTFLYAAPEVMSRPQDADARADIYGLGMTAVFALFGGDLAMDVIRDADRFIDRLPCNRVIHDVLKKAVAWDRNDRFSTAAEFVAALGHATEEDPVRGVSAEQVGAALPAMASVAATPAAASMAPGAAPARASAPVDRPAAQAVEARKPAQAEQAVEARKPAQAEQVAVAGKTAVMAAPPPAAGKQSVMAAPPPAVTKPAASAPSRGPADSGTRGRIVGEEGGASASGMLFRRASVAPEDSSSGLAGASQTVRRGRSETILEGPNFAVRARPPIVDSKPVASVEREDERSEARSSTAVYGAVALASAAADEPLALADDAPWDAAILVPERTGTSMLRAAVERANSGGMRAAGRKDSPPQPAAASSASLPREHVVADMSPRTAQASAGPTPPMQAEAKRARWALPVALLAVAAALLLVFLLPALLDGDPRGTRLTAEGTTQARLDSKRDEPPGPTVSPTVFPSVPSTIDPPTEPPTDPPVAPTTIAAPEASAGATAEPGKHATGEAPRESANEGPEPVGDEDEAGETGPVAPPSTTQASGEPETTQVAGDTKGNDTGGRPLPVVTVSSLISEGCAQVRSGDAEAGVALLLKASDRKPHDMKMQLCLADGYTKLNRWEAAASYYERLLDQYPRHTAALLGAAQSNEALNRRAAARVFYQQLLAIDPDSRSARAFLAEEDSRPSPRKPGP